MLLQNVGTYSNLDVHEPRYSVYPLPVITNFNDIALFRPYVNDSDESVKHNVTDESSFPLFCYCAYHPNLSQALFL